MILVLPPYMEVKNVEACTCCVSRSCQGINKCFVTDSNVFVDFSCSSTGSGHACVGCISTVWTNHSVCLVGGPRNNFCKTPPDVPAFNCFSTNSYKYCVEDKCGVYEGGASVFGTPGDDSTDGDNCRVTTSGWNTCGHHPATDGKWDKKEGKCVLCGGDSMDNTEMGVYGDSSGTYIAGGAPYVMSAVGMGKADNEFESACGADASCDEKVVTNVCAGGHCDKNGICCLSPKIVDAGGDCILPKKLVLTAMPVPNSIALNGTSTIYFTVTLNGLPVSGAKINGIALGGSAGGGLGAPQCPAPRQTSRARTPLVRCAPTAP